MDSSKQGDGVGKIIFARKQLGHTPKTQHHSLSSLVGELLVEYNKKL